MSWVLGLAMAMRQDLLRSIPCGLLRSGIEKPYSHNDFE